jgi:GNAT superfamily N-acetyltransferase
MSSPSSLTIRVAEPGDHAAIARLAGQLGYDSTPEAIADRVAKMGLAGEHGLAVAQLASGEIAGWIGVHISCTVETDPSAEVSGLVVDEARRSRGVGKALLAWAETWASKRGCDSITVRSNVIRERAHGFYQRHGFQHVKTQKTFRKKIYEVAFIVENGGAGT